MPTLVFAAVSLLLIALAIPLIRRRVRPNWIYGFRTPATLKDERLWYLVNAETGVDLLWVGVGQLAITAAHAAGLLPLHVFVCVAIGWMTLGSLFSLVHGLMIIRHERR